MKKVVETLGFTYKELAELTGLHWDVIRKQMQKGYCSWPRRTKDGRMKNPAWHCWNMMRTRCNNPKFHKYPDYGGRGISIHSSWDDFLVFLRDVGPRPSSAHSLDRIDNNGNYEPGNVRWATNAEQARNRRPKKKSRLHKVLPLSSSERDPGPSITGPL